MKRILILGNDNSINNIDFDKVKSSSIITAGVNRIHFKYMPNYFFFIDITILKELMQADVRRPKKSKWISCQYIRRFIEREKVNGSIYILLNSYLSDNQVRVFPNPKTISGISSVSWLIATLKEYIYPKDEVVFYIAGVSLKYNKDKHHFWCNDEMINRITTDYDDEWYKIRFNRQYKHFVGLIKKYNVISVTKGSRLNELVPYRDLNDILELCD